MWHHKLRRGGVLGAKLLADVGNPEGFGIAGLPQDITINGTTVSPTFRYEGKDATLSSWTSVVGETLTAAGSGGTVGLYVPTPDETARAVNSEGTRYWTDVGATAIADLGASSDMVLECVASFTTVANGYLVSTRESSLGWFLRRGSTADRLLFYINGTSGARSVNGNANLTEGAYYHILVFHDADGSTQMYVNADVSGGAVSGATGDVVADGNLSIGATSSGAIPGNKPIAYAAMYQGTDLLDSHLQPDFVQERFARLTGTYVSGWQAWPTQANLRNSVATIQRRVYGAEYQLFAVGPRWPRLENIRDVETDRDIDGVVSNSFPYSEDFTASGWGTIRASVDTGTGVYDHTGKTEMQGIVATAVADSHILYSDLTPSDTWKHIFVAEFSPGRTDAVRMQSVNQAAADVWVQFGLRGDGVVGASSAGVLASSITKLATDRYRCVMVYDGGTANHRHAFAPINDETVASLAYTGDGVNADLYLTAAQHDYSEATDGREAFAEYVRTVGVGRIVGKPGDGFMCEGQHTNLVTRSEELDDASWFKLRVTISADATVAPDNEQTMDAIAEDGATGTRYISKAFASAAGTYTWCGFLKAANRFNCRMSFFSSTDGSAYADFDLSNGTVIGSSAVDDSGIAYFRDGIYFAWVTDTRATAESQSAFLSVLDDAGNPSFAGLSQDSIYFWGAQLTATQYPVSYIKTEGATVTRLGDDTNFTGLSLPLAGSMACDHLSSNALTGSVRIGLVSDGTSGNRVLLFRNNADLKQIVVSGTSVESNEVSSIGLDANKWQEARLTYETDSVKTLIDGVVGINDTSAAMPITLTKLSLGAGFSGGAELNGRVRVRLFSKPTLKNPTEFK
jgi:hypothetical protein